MPKSNNVAALSFTGKGAKARLLAFGNITPLSFAEDKSRAATLANLRLVLGSSPSEAEVKAAKVRWIIGRVASRLPLNARGTAKTETALLAFAEQLVTSYAAPPKEGTKAKALRKDQIGRRSAAQQKVVRAAEEACSVTFAELGLTKASTNAQRDAKKAAGAPSMAGSGKGKPTPPSAAQLVRPDAPVTSDDYVQHMQTQMAALLAYDNKYAKKRPTTHGAFAEGLAALKQVVNKAANEYQLRKAAAQAKAA